MSVPGYWLRELFLKFGDNLFSANYRGFLGVNRRKKINSGIKNTAEKKPENFWVFNNGITILTTGLEKEKSKYILKGVSIINGAQTTGSIGSIESSIDLKNVRVLTRIIECSDSDTIDEIVKYNNTQNKITTWDKFSNDPQQKRIQEEFSKYGHEYSLKRGFDSNSHLGIEVVGQPTIALEGFYSDANSGKNGVFENERMYRLAFEDKKARHILFAYILAKAIDERRYELKSKQSSNVILPIEEKQLILLRNLRFKYFFISIVGKTLDVLLGKNVNLAQVGFTPDYSKRENKSIIELTADMLPIINLLLTYTSTFITKDFSEFIREEGVLDSVSKQVSAMVYAQQSSTPSPVIDKLKTMLN